MIDNVEPVLDSAPEVGRLLVACPSLQMVATSRAALRVAGEQEYPVPPLSEDEAVELFAERARAVRPGFELDGQRPAVAEICARLDGLPLAIELAASRVKMLPPPKLLERLDLALLTSGARDAPERHKTLRATIDWSYDLLDEPERALLARLSVFAGGFTVEGAETVCSASLDGLASLVEKSLVAERDPADGEPLFALLETVREYAYEQLVARCETDVMGRRHAEYVLRSIEDAGYRHSPMSGLATHVARDWEGVRAARAWFEAAGDVERELRLAMHAYWAIWKIAGTAEVCGWLVGALECAEEIDRGVLADAHGTVALAAYNLGDEATSRRHAERSLTLARELGDNRRIEWGLRAMSFTEQDLGERRRMLGECEALLREFGEPAQLGWIKSLEAGTFELERDWRAAQAKYDEAAANIRPARARLGGNERAHFRCLFARGCRRAGCRRAGRRGSAAHERRARVGPVGGGSARTARGAWRFRCGDLRTARGRRPCGVRPGAVHVHPAGHERARGGRTQCQEAARRSLRSRVRRRPGAHP